jgi:hypothetical protein
MIAESQSKLMNIFLNLNRKALRYQARGLEGVYSGKTKEKLSLGCPNGASTAPHVILGTF